VRARTLAAAVAATVGLAAGWLAVVRPPSDVARDVRPNVILIVTDDQTFASMQGRPVAMPWLTAQLDRPGWTTFSNAVVTTPLCCPSRASILTGRYASHTGVETNDDGVRLDDGDTVAVWLHDAGYRTALVGKYLNGYPWDASPGVPQGWDRWFAKLNASRSTVYYGYDVVDQGIRRTVGTDPADYATDLLAEQAVAFVRGAPADRPFFLTFTPSAPHEPAEPAPRYASLIDGTPPEVGDARLATLTAVDGAPSWIEERRPIDAASAAALELAKLRERGALHAVDDAFRDLWDAVAARGELDRTVWLFLSDNGYSFGERRWVGKTCPWEVCVHVPFVAFVPGTAGGSTDTLVANIDVAPTIAELAGLELDGTDHIDVAPNIDGMSLAAHLLGGPPPDREGVLLEWTGDARVPTWVAIRLRDAVLIRHADGTRELYDLAADPAERRNLIDDPSATALRARAVSALDASLAALEGAG
jgi:N-acetylglucosamine-6-sulfatase